MSEVVDHLLTRARARYPERIAVVDGDRQATYRELDELATRLANLLRDECGVGRGDRVGLYLDKSLEAVAALYGVMAAGGAYVPLDPSAPPARLAGIVADAGLAAIVSGREQSELWPQVVRGSSVPTIIALDTDEEAVAPDGGRVLTRRDVEAGSAEAPRGSTRSSSDLAYILYTSGSTGVPKGVMLSHSNALAFVDWAVEEFEVTEGDRLSSHAPLHFDLSVFDLFAASHAGATLVLVPGQLALFPVELARWMRQQELTVWYSVPSVLTLLARRGKLEENHPDNLRVVLFAGEVFPPKYLARIMELIPEARFANLFGPTETNVCTWYEATRWTGEPPLSIPIGKSITGDDTVAVGEDGEPVPDGEVGELWVTGATVMQGYWGDEERTAATLLRASGGVNTYRTGDLVRRDEDGNWIFLGRRDAQIKSRGYRIELGDVEAALHLHPAVVDCAVVAVPDELISNRIEAFVVVRGDVDAESLSRFCHERIPHYMVPERFQLQDELPRTSTGKVDRRTLAGTTTKA